MKNYFDIIVIGSGSGLTVSSYAANQGLKVAVVEEGPFGGTCLNRGCIPSKMLIHSADIAEEIKRASDFGIDAVIKKIRFSDIVNRVTNIIDQDAYSIEKANEKNPHTTIFKKRGVFTDKNELTVGNQKITANKIFIVAGARTFIPPIKGLEKTPYLTSKEALRLKKQPQKLIIIGGGYIAAELGHFFGALGTRVIIFQRNKLLIPNEDEDIAQTFTTIFSQKYNIHTETQVNEVLYENNKFTVVAKTKKGKIIKEESDALLVAVGVKPNTDILQVEKAGIEVTEKGYIKVNEYLETSQKNIWAFGDIIGKYLFKHSANWESFYAVQNAFGDIKKPADYTAMPHAIFSSPQIAGVGETERGLKEKGIKYQAAKYYYKNTGMGEALQEKNGFVKVLADPEGNKILGAHIIGPDASVLIQEIVQAMKITSRVSSIKKTIHIHPSLTEVVQRAFNTLKRL